MSEYYINGVLYRHEPPDKLVPVDSRMTCPKCGATASFDGRWCGFNCLSVTNCRWTKPVKKFASHGDFERFKNYAQLLAVARAAKEYDEADDFYRKQRLKGNDELAPLNSLVVAKTRLKGCLSALDPDVIGGGE